MSELNMVRQMLPMIQTQVQPKSANPKANENAVDSFEKMMSEATDRKNSRPVKANEGKPATKERVKGAKPQDPAVVEQNEEEVVSITTTGQPDPAILMSLVIQPLPEIVSAVAQSVMDAEHAIMQAPATEIPAIAAEQPVTADIGTAQTPIPAEVLSQAEFQPIELPKPEQAQAAEAGQSIETVSQTDAAQSSAAENSQVKQENDHVPAIETEPENSDDAKTTPVGEMAKQPIGTERLNIKVGENFDIQKPEFPQQVADKILYSVKDGVQSLEIQLEPYNLGKIIINVVVENGKAVVTMACANPKTQELLSEQIGNIRSILESNTGNQTVVNVEKQDQQMNQRENYEGHGGDQQKREQKDSHKPNADEVNIFIDQLRMGMKVATMY